MIRVAPAEDHGLALDVIQTNGGTQSRASLNDQVVKDVPLALIVADSQAQPRKAIKTDVWVDYQEAMERGDTFPPVTVFYDGSKYWLADGFHRVYAARSIGRTEIRCEIHQGGLRDAVLYSVGVNHAHGLQRTDADRRRAIMLLLEDEEWGQWSDREIARRCKVHHTTVARVKADIRAFYQGEARDAGGKYRPGRKAVWDDPRIERITGDVASDSRGRKFRSKHGTTATMKTAGINASRNQFQAKASEDNGSITGGAGAVTGEASRLASGRTDAGEAASADLPTIPRNIVAEVRELWNLATPSEREEIRAIINSASDGGPEGRKRLQVAREPINAAEPDVLAATREGLSMERGIDQCVTAGETALNSKSDDDAFAAVTGKAQLANAAGVEPSSSDNPSASPRAEAVADPQASQAPKATATPFVNPHCQRPATCKWARSQATCAKCSDAAMKARAAA